MLGRMNGRQLAGWGYGLFWMGLLAEVINAFVSAQASYAPATPAYWVGIAVAGTLVVSGISMLTMIRHRPW